MEFLNFDIIVTIHVISSQLWIEDIEHCHRYQDFIHKNVIEIVEKEGIPDWFFLAGPHGEFELVFTIPPDQLKHFLDSALQLEWEPLLIGSVIEQPAFMYPKDDAVLELDIFSIANLFVKSGGNPKKYFEELYKMNQLWQEK